MKEKLLFLLEPFSGEQCEKLWKTQKLRRNDPIPFISDVINAPPENSCHSVLLSLWRPCTRQDLSFPWAHKRPPKTQRELGGFLADRLLKEKDVRKWSIKNQNIHIWATEAKNSRPDPSSLAVGYHLIRWGRPKIQPALKGTPITLILFPSRKEKKQKQAVNYPIEIHVFFQVLCHLFHLLLSCLADSNYELVWHLLLSRY